MKTTTLACLAVILCLNAHAQNDQAISPVSVEDLKLTSCSFETSANAMKLLDVQQVEFEPSAFGGKIRSQKTVRIKIFNERGYNAATITIPYFSNKKNTKVESISGTVYSLDAKGEVTRQALDENDFYKEKAMEKIGMIRFTFPNIRPGSIVEYSYTISEKNRLVIDNWQVQSEIPSRYAELSILIPGYSALRDVTFGTDSVSKKTEVLTKGFDKQKVTYFKQNIPSFTPEPFMSSLSDNLLRMGFMLIEDNRRQIQSNVPMWRFFAANLIRSQAYADMQNKPIPGTEKVIDTALSYEYGEDRLRFLYRVIRNHFSQQAGTAASADDLAEAWKKKQGSSAEINFILHNFLTRAKVKNYPVFVSTRDHGKIKKEFPSFSQFNHIDILAEINGKQYLLDASLKYQNYQAPPLNILNREVLVLNPDNIDWALVTDDRPLQKQTTDIFGTLTTKGVLEGGATINYYDYTKMMALDTSLSTEENDNQRFFEKNIPGLKILNDNRINIDNDEPMMRTIEFDYELNNQGDFYFINPQLFASNKMNPFVKEKRLSDIDFGSNQEIRLNMQLDIPPSFQPEELPKNMVIKSPDESFVFTRIISVYQSKISYSHVLEIKKAIFDKTEYAALADFFKQVQKLASEEIILKKKS